MKTATIGFPKILLGLAVLFSAPSVHAEDIEVYYSNPDSGGQANVLMLMDTSGSMDNYVCVEWDPPGSNNCVDTNRRMDELKRALKETIDAMSGNVSMGLARYNYNDGGRILYPVKPLDDFAFDGSTETYVNDDAGDAFEQNGNFQAHYIDFRFPNAYDETGGNNGGHVGFWFEEVEVPRHADVSSATVRILAASDSNDTIKYRAFYEDNFDSVDFDDNQDVDGRIPGSQTGWTGEISGNWNAWNYYEIDVTDLVQDAVSQDAWCGGKNLTIIFTHEGTEANDRMIFSMDRTGSAAPRLTVEWDPTEDPSGVTNKNTAGYESTLACQGNIRYSLGGTNDDAFEDDSQNRVYINTNNMEIGADNYVGLRFPGIPFDLRHPATPDVLNEVKLHFIGDGDEEGMEVRVRALLGDQPPFENENGNIIDRPRGSELATYDIVDRFDYDQTMDVTNVVREALEHNDWVRGGTLGLWVHAENFAIMDALDTGTAYGAWLEFSVSSPEMRAFVPRVRDELKQAVDELEASGNTPTMESLSEAARYMLGRNEEYAYEDVGSSYYDDKDVWEGGSTHEYKSPIDTTGCGSNAIVSLTDGEPTQDYDYDAVTDLTGKSSCRAGDWGDQASYNCQVQLAEWLYDGTSNGAGTPITVHTVAFNEDEDINTGMARISAAGNGQHKFASNAESLAQSFQEIINQVTVENASMAAPGVAVNQLNRFQFLNQLYYAVFKPSVNTRWLGNLKRYKLDVSGDEPVIRDEAGLAAVDPNDGFFKDTASSWWDDAQDGQDVAQGGAANELVPANRKLFVMTSEPGTENGETATSPVSTTSPTLFDEWDDIAGTALGLPSGASDTQRQLLFGYLKQAWGDPLHSEPRLVNYGFTGDIEDAFDDPSKQDNTIFVSTNDGMLHAIDTSDGSEYFAFMPASTLVDTKERFDNPKVNENPLSRSTYGLDSSWTAWRVADTDGQAKNVYLFGGMRRGGSHYYGLDVSDRSSPKVMWSIQGGSGDFANLGQTWSEPTLAAVRIDGDRVPVLVFGGGYSAADHDTENDVSGGDSVGNSIYIVNAFTGDLIWEGSDSGADTNNGDMDYSIPSSIAVVDYDLDGAVDFLYAADLGGQIFRVDIDNDNGGTGGLVTRIETVAKLGITDGSGIGDHRRFYASPVVVAGKRDGQTTVQVVIGSGYRAHPLDKLTNDRLFVVDDAGALQALSGGSYTSPGVVTDDDLVDVTSDTTPDQDDLDDSSGWYMDLVENGEKVLAPAAVLQGKIYFTSYVPEVTNTTNACSNVLGSARLYIVDLNTGAPAGDFNNDGSVDGTGTSDRYLDQNLRGLPPQPQVLVGVAGGGGGGGGGGSSDPCENQDGKITVLTGTAVTSGGTLRGCGLQKTRWYETNEDDANDRIDSYSPIN